MSLAKEIMDVVKVMMPNSKGVVLAESIMGSSSDPASAEIVKDLETAHSLLNEFRQKINELHPSVADIFKILF